MEHLHLAKAHFDALQRLWHMHVHHLERCWFIAPGSTTKMRIAPTPSLCLIRVNKAKGQHEERDTDLIWLVVCLPL